MEHSRRNILFSSAFLLFLLLPVTIPAQLLPIVDDTSSNHHIYIIHVDRHKTHDLLGDEELESFHRSFLPNTTLDSGLPRLVYSYRHVISGFAARLTPNELDVIRSMPGVLSADLDQVYQLETTYTPKYLGLTKQNGWGGTMMGNGMVIGIIDSGIKPGHPSFSDYHMPPAPPTWNGNCTTPGSGFVCNNKIISGKAFSGGTHPSPVDTNGHGTHVASIAAGRQVNGASVLGTAKGVAIGMAPKAHLAIYKVCFANGCDGMDIIAAIDQAIKDGVDVINMSISGSPTAPLYDDSVALGSMAAIQHGIVAVSSAGNRGPKTMSLSHCAPWVIAVGAVSTDRRATSKVELGDGRTFNGQTAYQPVNTFDSSKFYPLEFPGKNGNVAASCCVPNALSNMNFRGQIVLCNPGIIKDEEKGEAVYARGAEGMIILNLPQQGYTTFSKAHVIAASNVNYPDGVDILDYFYKNTNNATATFRFFDTEFGFMPSPSIGYFSSRGPSQMNGGLIKPDVVAPGVNILAAWIKDVGPNPDPMATHTFNFDSGTSMAAPHVSGIASLVKSQHRDWTPAEILSAIVTTAKDSMSGAGGLLIDDSGNKTAGIHTMGAGLVNPVKALDPGLVYELQLTDYVKYLCGLGYNSREVTKTVGKQTTCTGLNPLSASELNYPSISVNLTKGIASLTVNRTVTNVGMTQETYQANIVEPAGVSVYLSTYQLQFSRYRQQESFDITFASKGKPLPGTDPITRGKIVWDSGMHLVTSPIAVRLF